jgi:hypothetical protein
LVERSGRWLGGRVARALGILTFVHLRSVTLQAPRHQAEQFIPEQIGLLSVGLGSAECRASRKIRILRFALNDTKKDGFSLIEATNQ